VRVTEELEVLKTFTGRLHQASVIKVDCIVRKDSVPDPDRQYLTQRTDRLGLGPLYREALGA
jgi:hypothetical protein